MVNLGSCLNFLICFNNVVITEGKPIPTELRNEEAALRQQIDLEDDHTASMYSLHLCFLFSEYNWHFSYVII